MAGRLQTIAHGPHRFRLGERQAAGKDLGRDIGKPLPRRSNNEGDTGAEGPGRYATDGEFP